jgi:membrane-associated PAP2 superfamily phosphatase
VKSAPAPLQRTHDGSADRLTSTLLGLSVALAALLYFVPEIDLAASRALADGSHGFPLAHDERLYLLNRIVNWIARVGTIALLLAAFFSWTAAAPRARALRWLRDRRRELLYLVAVAALGPGLTVNVLLKEHGGRARPVQIEQFGGSKRFTRAFEITDQCQHNCAFPSGHVAAAAFPVVGYFLARGRRARRAWLAGGLAGGVTIGLARMLTGSHYLSDVVFSILIVFAVAALCAVTILRSRAQPAPA